MSTAVSDMMEGGFMEPVLHDPKLQNKTGYLPKHTDEFDWLRPEGTAEAMHHWLIWVHLLSGSLLARSCEVVAVLGNLPNHIQQSAHCYGQHLALARQLSKDLHHFSNNPNINQLQPTNAVLVRASQDLLDYDSEQQSTVQRIKNSSIVDELSELCLYHGRRAGDSLQELPYSDAKDILLKMAQTQTSYPSNYYY
jgi:decaprenyl-diphosphate synthase subunit 2